MTTYYVATLARYILIQADNEDQARERGRSALTDGDAPFGIHTVRLATADEIELSEWHQQFAAS